MRETNSNSTAQSSGGGIGFAGALFLVFLVLKLTGIIDWSWWWVTAPLWGSLALGLIVLGICGLLVWWTTRTE